MLRLNRAVVLFALSVASVGLAARPVWAQTADGTLSTGQAPPAPVSPTMSGTAPPSAATVPLAPAARDIGMTPEDVGVMDRHRATYDAKGIPLGAFRLFPTMDVIGTYDDNILRQQTGTADWYIAEAPQLRLESQWGRHFLEVYSGLNNFNYTDNTRLNLTDWNLGSDGRLDLIQGTSVTGGFSYGRTHESLASPNTVGAQNTPNRSFVTNGSLSGLYKPNRFGVRVNGSFTRSDWSDTQLIGGGAINNSDRNEDEYKASARTMYDFSPEYTGFFQVGYDSRTFDVNFDRTGAHRASTGYHADGGVEMQLSHLIRGEFYAGYLEQHYAQNVPIPLHNVSGLDFGANLDWFVTPVLTAHLNATHTLNDVTISRSAVSNDEAVRVSTDYELAYNLLVQGYVSYTHSKFTGTTRTDEYPGAGVSLNYLANEYFSAHIGYNYSERASNVGAADFNDNMISIALTAHI